MVKKKGKSKRTSLGDKYKMQKRVLETNRKKRKQGKRDSAAGVVKHDKKKDPGIPNSWPFKADLLRDIQRGRERQVEADHETKEKRKLDLKALRDHQTDGGTARTIQELMDQATKDQGAFQAKQGDADNEQDKEKSDGAPKAGQQSRRAYLRELKKVVDTADVLLQVLDARDPIGSRMHPSMEDAILSRADKRMVLVLNKIDLVPKNIVGDWLLHLRRSHPTIAIKASANVTGTDEDATTSSIPVGMDGLLQLLKNYARTGGAGGKSKTCVVVGIIGYPNVGKSSIINALKRCRAVGVSPRPGFTTSMQEVVLDRNVTLLDSPGIVFDDRSAMLGNCVDSESIDDPIPPVAALLQRCNHGSLLMTYNIPSFPEGDVMTFLALVARSYGRVLKGGVPDKNAAARAVLRDWNTGKIPYYTAPPKAVSTTVAGEAVVVSSFGAEFDLSKFDEVIMKDLKDTNEVDFVKLEEDSDADYEDEDEEMELDDKAVRDRAAKYLAKKSGNDAMDEGSSDEDEDAPARAKLANAEAYDFNDM